MSDKKKRKCNNHFDVVAFHTQIFGMDSAITTISELDAVVYCYYYSISGKRQSRRQHTTRRRRLRRDDYGMCNGISYYGQVRFNGMIVVGWRLKICLRNTRAECISRITHSIRTSIVFFNTVFASTRSIELMMRCTFYDFCFRLFVRRLFALQSTQRK